MTLSFKARRRQKHSLKLKSSIDSSERGLEIVYSKWDASNKELKRETDAKLDNGSSQVPCLSRIY